MRKSTTFLIFLLLSLHLIAQEKYKFNFTGKTLYDAVEQLSEKHQFKFSYDHNQLNRHWLNAKVTANSDAELISKIFEDLPFKIQLSKGVYLIIPKKSETEPARLIGHVYDKRTGEPLVFAHVQSNNYGTLSDEWGKFTFPPRNDIVPFQISYVGYKDLNLNVSPNQKYISLNLEQNPLVLQEVVLNTFQEVNSNNNTSFFSLNPKKFNALPTLGETDVFKSLQLLPGVQATDETSSGLFIRGSTPSQNLVQLDGMTLYHLDHFFGIFSTINPSVINNMNLYKGGFGAEYGGKVSSVVDMSGKAGSKDTFSGRAGVNFLSFNGLIETPIGTKSSLLLGGRQSFTSIIQSSLFNDFLSTSRNSHLASIDPGIVEFQPKPALNFFDLNGKFQHQFKPTSIWI